MNGIEEAVGSPIPWPADVKLSLIIPAYNEGMRLEAGISRLLAAIEAGAIDIETTEFVVVDDGSTDDTTPLARALFEPFPHVQHVRLSQNRGKGGAVRAGVAVARAPIIAFADADMAIDPAQTPQFVRALADASIAIGSRSARGASVNRPSFRRSLMNRVFNRLVNAITRVSLNDTQCGFKAFRAPVAKLLFHCSVTERFAFDVEILSLARRLGFTIAEVPVQWLRVKGSQIRPWTDARSMAADVVRAGRGAAWAAPIPTLGIKLPSELVHGPDGSVSRTSLRKALAPWLPVVDDGHDGRLLVLCPQMSEPEIETTAAWISAHFAGAALERSALTVAQLCEMAPLLLTWGDEPGAPEGDVVSPFPMATKRAGS
jgi:dolichyl-phosphate beta-glucosyltransferase